MGTFQPPSWFPRAPPSPSNPLQPQKHGDQVARVISLFVYLDLRWRQGLWRAHHHHHRSGQAGSSPRLNQDWSSSHQRSGLRHICQLFSKNLAESVDMAGFIFCTIHISLSLVLGQYFKQSDEVDHMLVSPMSYSPRVQA